MGLRYAPNGCWWRMVATSVGQTGMSRNMVFVAAAVTVDNGTHGKRTYRAGTAFMEAMDVWHDGTNDGPAPCRILVVFMGSDKSANVIKK